MTRHRWLSAAIVGTVAIVAAIGLARRAASAHGRGNELAVLNGCADCHSPPGGPPLSGYLLGAWLAPNITPDVVSGIGGWSREEVFQYLRLGRVAGKSQAAGPMGAIVEGLTELSDADTYAIVDWLARQPPHRNPGAANRAAPRAAPLASEFEDGRVYMFVETADTALSPASLYNAACASCHGAHGAGSPDRYYPSMFHTAAGDAGIPYNLLAVLLFGVDRAVTDVSVLMPSFDAARDVPGGLTDEELATVATFVVKHFANASGTAIQIRDIQRTRAGLWAFGEPSAARGELVAVGGGGAGGDGACFRCHGLNGRGDAAGAYPRLAGLDAGYIAKQMQDYRSGRRPNDVMTAIAERLDRSDDQGIALYYAALPTGFGEAPRASSVASPIPPGAALYMRGAPERGIDACARCHGDDARGLRRVYPSVLQSVSYTAGQLRLWRSGVRRNDYGGVMGRVARPMRDEDIRAVSAFIATIAR